MCIEEAKNILKLILETESIVSYMEFIGALEIVLKLLDEHETGKYTYPTNEIGNWEKLECWLSDELCTTRQASIEKNTQHGDKDESYIKLIGQEIMITRILKRMNIIEFNKESTNNE